MDHGAVSGYMPHGFCFLWEPRLVWLHVISDILTGIAYYSIPVALFYFVYKRRDLPFLKIFILFGVFIFACGTTHLLAAYTVYVPQYWLEGTVKAITAFVSILSAILFIPLIPEAIAMPSLTKALEEIKGLNKTLEKELTEHKAAELAKTESEAKMRTLVQTIPDLVWLKDPDGVYLSCNAMFERLFGTKEADIAGKTDYDFVDKGTADFFRENDHKAVAAGKPCSNEEWFTFADDGHRVLMHTIKTPMFDGKGNLIGVLGIARDITSRKRAEEKLRKSERQLMESQSVAHLGNWDLNLDSRVLEWSAETYRLFDKSPESFVPSFDEFARMVHPDDHASMLANIDKALDSDATPYHAVVRIINDSGREWVNETFGVVRRDSSGKALGIFGTAQDITERKEYEERIRQSLLEKETLLRELYHRTKNNMQVISSLLTLQTRDIDDKKTLQILDDTKNRIYSMAMVHEKLYKAKNLSQVYLNDYIKDLASALMESHNADKEHVSLKVDVECIAVSIDTITPLGLVINELMTNALKYAFPDEREGRITITAHLNEDEIIEIRFSDNGIGMPKDINLKETESLGLMIVRMLVESQINGELEMQTQNGTAFIIKFRDKDIRARI